MLELVEEVDGIENLDHLGQFLLLLGREYPRQQESLQRSFGWIIHTTNLFPVAFFREQLHGGLKAVDIQAQRTVELGQLTVGVFSHEAIIADHLAHNNAIFLFYKALISFLIGSASGKGDLLLFTIRDHDLIDELSTVIGINPQNRKREQGACALESSQHRLLAAAAPGLYYRRQLQPAVCR